MYTLYTFVVYFLVRSPIRVKILSKGQNFKDSCRSWAKIWRSDFSDLVHSGVLKLVIPLNKDTKVSDRRVSKVENDPFILDNFLKVGFKCEIGLTIVLFCLESFWLFVSLVFFHISRSHDSCRLPCISWICKTGICFCSFSKSCTYHSLDIDDMPAGCLLFCGKIPVIIISFWFVGQ